MAQFKVHKFVSALPSTLEPDAVYFVRAGTGFDLYVTNSSGTVVAYELNKTANTGSFVDWEPVVATGTGSPQNITLPESGLSPKNVLVIVEGVAQPSSEYTISGTALNITVDLGMSIEIRKLVVVANGVTPESVIDKLPLMYAPQITYLTAGSGEYDTPAGALYLEVEARGGGSGGSGSGGFSGGAPATPAQGSSVSAGNTTFGSITAYGAGPTNGRFGAPGGAATGGDINKVGHNGGTARDYYNNQAAADGGGEGAGRSAPDMDGEAASPNTGAGGAGAGTGGEREGGGGGGQGGFARKIISNPAAKYTYSVGAGSAGGEPGVNGKRGGPGAAGYIIVKAYFR